MPAVVIVSVPTTDTESLLMAPGVLKSALGEIGIHSVALDLNQEVRQKIKHHPRYQDIMGFMLTEQVPRASIPHIRELLDFMVRRIMIHDPDWVCLSLLTYLSQITCKWLCLALRQHKPHVRIVIGGPGCFSSLKSIDSFAPGLKASGLIDHYVTGDGERAIQELLQGNIDYAGINSAGWKELENLDQLPLPDYSDYDFSLYRNRSVGIWGSRGCVRQCTFCDIHEHWSQFQWRSAESIFAEIKQQRELYGINIFRFSDSLINGNQREYRRLIQLLADYNSTLDPHDRVRWISFFIFRPEDQMSENDWLLTAQSGAMLLMVGVESFVDHVRQHLKKHFTNLDLDYNLRMAKKYKIKLNLLFVVGYATDTEQSHQENLRWIEQNREFANDPVMSVQIGSTLAILPGTWLFRNQEQLGVRLRSEDVYQDWVSDITGSTPEIRMRWHQEIQDQLQRHGWQCQISMDNHVLIEKYLQDVKQ